MDDIHWMQHAISLAKTAENKGEVPVGAVLVFDNEIIGEGFNQPIGLSDPTAHAEIIALREGGRALSNYRLPGSTLYVTLEPCVMCLGALIHARVLRIVFGACDLRAGALQSAFQLGSATQFNHRLNFEGGVLADTCGALLSNFFKARR